jgi:hypothetical protein
MPRGGVRLSPPELGNMVPRGGPTLPRGLAERWHRNLLSLAKERNPATGHLRLVHRPAENYVRQAPEYANWWLAVTPRVLSYIPGIAIRSTGSFRP